MPWGNNPTTLKHSQLTLLEFSSNGFDTMNSAAFRLCTPFVLMLEACLLNSMHTSDKYVCPGGVILLPWGRPKASFISCSRLKLLNCMPAFEIARLWDYTTKFLDRYARGKSCITKNIPAIDTGLGKGGGNLCWNIFDWIKLVQKNASILTDRWVSKPKIVILLVGGQW